MTTGRINQVTFVRPESRCSGWRVTCSIHTTIRSATDTSHNQALHTCQTRERSYNHLRLATPITGVKADRTCVCNNNFDTNNQMSPPGSAARHQDSVIHRGYRPGTSVRSLWFFCTFPRPCLIQMQLAIDRVCTHTYTSLSIKRHQMISESIGLGCKL